MSQIWNDDTYASTHTVATDMQAIEDNFACLKSSFSGSSAPSNPVAGMWWYDTSANILKLRNEANDAWQSVWDFANSKPLASNLVSADFGSALKDPAAGTAGLRTVGTGAQQACAGNDARLSDNRTPLDASITQAKLANAAAGSQVECSGLAATSSAPAYYWATHYTAYMPRAGTVRVVYTVWNNLGPAGYSNIFKNGGAVGTQRNVTEGPTQYSEDISVAAGDYISICCYQPGSSVTYYVSNFRIQTSACLQSAAY